MVQIKHSFLETIQELRRSENMVLYDKMISISHEEEQLVIELLFSEYQNECLESPLNPPEFDENAALWASKIIYHAAQLLLYREQKVSEIETLFANFEGEMTNSAILSADLCLRFVPQIIFHAKSIDPEDSIISILENLLQTWHYSGISHELNYDKLDFESILSDECLRQLYINRIIQFKSKKLAELEHFSDLVKGKLGDHSNIFWKELTDTI